MTLVATARLNRPASHKPDGPETCASLARLLQAAHERSRLPDSVVAGLVGISESYFSKLVNGHRRRPSRDLLLSLGYVWGIRELDDIDKILEAAGHPKLSRPAQ
jgi:hypothetical protein